MRSLAVLGILALAACAHTPVYSGDQVEAIMRPLAYEQEIDRKCEEEKPASDADRFLASLGGDAAEQADEILNLIAVEVEQGEAEYICTVELYFSTQERANDARALWKSLKGNW